MADKISIEHMEQTGLIAVSLYDQTVELTLEDIQEIQALRKEVGDKNIARRDDFVD